MLYDQKTYEEVFKKERNEVTLEYKDAFERNKRLPQRKVEEILSILVSDYIIDEMVVSNLNPRIKMYDDSKKYAENITTYSLRFINNKTNRIEIYEKEPKIRRLGNGVVSGFCSNDPYVRLDDMPIETNFLLNQTSYYWLKDNGKGQEEISIYTALNKEEYETYSELNKNRPEIKYMIEKVIRQQNVLGRTEKNYNAYLEEMIKALNLELVSPTIDVMSEEIGKGIEAITPILYRYRFTTDPVEFEKKLYISIEDSIGKDYKYKISEPILEDLTRIGNKLDYTDEKGNIVKRQSVADFNVNAPTAVITKETFIDSGRIDDLLGYIYEDVEDNGTEKLPIPSIYVDIYIPKNPEQKVSMYNGTSLDFTLNDIKEKGMFFNNADDGSFISGGESLPGTTFVTVMYVNSKGEILKENKIRKFIPWYNIFSRDITYNKWYTRKRMEGRKYKTRTNYC